MVIVVMGVSGSGKSTIGRALAERLEWPFLDADDFHPPANIEKMRAGQPLTDRDRTPWLQRLRLELAKLDHAVLACSALKESYRQQLEPARWVFLDAPPNLIQQRIESRIGHFMPPQLLQSQFDTLEPPADAIRPDIRQPPQAVVEEILQRL